MRNLLTHSATLALADQFVVSATRFATTLIVGRMCGPEGLGAYSVAFSVVIAVALLQETLLAKPFIFFVKQYRPRRLKICSGSIAAHLFGLVAIVVVILLLAAAFMSLMGSEYARLSLALAAATPGVLLWEFVRRYNFAKMKMGTALAIDLSLSAVQIVGLLLLGLQEAVTVNAAIAFLGIVGLAVGTPALYLARHDFWISRKWVGVDAARNWKFGKWMLAGQLIGLTQAYSVPILIAVCFGAWETGVFMAAQTLVLLSNPFLLGFGNWLSPAAAHVYASEGLSGLVRLTTRSIGILLATTSLFCATLAIIGEPLMRACFGEEYTGNGALITILGLAAIGFGVSIATTSGLAAIDRPRSVLVGTIGGTLVAALGFFPLSSVASLNGAALAMTLGSLVCAGIHTIAFYRVAGLRFNGMAKRNYLLE